jgi:hypothetical protein
MREEDAIDPPFLKLRITLRLNGDSAVGDRTVLHLPFSAAIVLFVCSCDFVDCFSFLSPENDPRSTPSNAKQVQQIANDDWKTIRSRVPFTDLG